MKRPTCPVGSSVTPLDFELAAYQFELPAELIAQVPPARRGESRLLTLDRSSGAWGHRRFHDLPTLLEPGDLLVMNDSRVLPARLRGVRPTGGQAEVLLLRRIGEATPQHYAHAERWEAIARPSSRLRSEVPIEVGAQLWAFPEDRQGEGWRMRLEADAPIPSVLESVGELPLPPYIERRLEAIALRSLDRDRYQTVYARESGSAAAPTAGLHFSREILDELQNRGVGLRYVTLHVGTGTFSPVRTEDIRQHRLHSECYSVERKVWSEILAARQSGRRVVAVGTTSVRTLEALWQASRRGGDPASPSSASLSDSAVAAAAMESGSSPDRILGETDIFIYPGYTFGVVDAIITNFHLPQSSLLMLVSAFAGRDRILAAYAGAIAERYRFFSYGDATWIA